MHPPYNADQPEQFFRFCLVENIRLSVKCKLLLNVFCRVNDFIDAESLWLMIKSDGQQISRATVYKLLDKLCTQGYVTRKKAEHASHTVFKLELLID